MSMTRHVGRIKNTGSRVAIVFRELPDDPSYCLVCEVERLPDLLHDNLMEIINGTIAQGTVNLYEALGRTLLNDGTNALNTLHRRGFLSRVPIDIVEAIPLPNRPVPLADINRAIAGEAVDLGSVAESAPANKTNKVEPAVADISSNTVIAQGLIMQAEAMEADAKAKREEAMKLAPELFETKKKPAKRTSRKKVVAESTPK